MAIPQSKATSSDKRGLGLTFLGMMSNEESQYLTKEDLEILLLPIYREIESLRDRIVRSSVVPVKPSLYKRFWRFITREEKGNHA